MYSKVVMPPRTDRRKFDGRLKFVEFCIFLLPILHTHADASRAPPADAPRYGDEARDTTELSTDAMQAKYGRGFDLLQSMGSRARRNLFVTAGLRYSRERARQTIAKSKMHFSKMHFSKMH